MQSFGCQSFSGSSVSTSPSSPGWPKCPGLQAFSKLTVGHPLPRVGRSWRVSGLPEPGAWRRPVWAAQARSGPILANWPRLHGNTRKMGLKYTVTTYGFGIVGARLPNVRGGFHLAFDQSTNGVETTAVPQPAVKLDVPLGKISLISSISRFSSFSPPGKEPHSHSIGCLRSPGALAPYRACTASYE